MRLIILNGFDRSGTSFIGGLLSRHPKINYFFQPFSGTEVHKTQYEVWGADYQAPAAKSFLDSMQKGCIESGYLASDWFERFSSYDLGRQDALGLIKETKLHAKLEWLKSTFPEIPVYGIWRDPRAVLCSLLRNGFHRKWYGASAFTATDRLVRTNPRLHRFLPLLDKPLSHELQMALILAVRTQLMLFSLDQQSWLRYENVLVNPNDVLNGFCERSGLETFNFTSWADQDYNVIGLPYQRQDLWKNYFKGAFLKQVNGIFNRLESAPDVAA